MMKSMGIVQATLTRRVPELRETDDNTMDFIKSQQRTAFCEVIDMMTHHGHIKQTVRDYCQGLLAASAQEKIAIQEDHFQIAPKTLGAVDENWIGGMLVRHTKLFWSNVSKCRSFDPKIISKFWQ